MAEILKEWLTERLKKPITWEAHEFGEMMKNGYIIAGVLKSYHAINDDKHYLIINSIASADIDNNWKYLSQWLHQIDVPVLETDIQHIKAGRGSTLLRVFYQMFLQLDKRDRTDFIKRERQAVSSLVEKTDTRFKVEKVPEPKEASVVDLSRPLLNEKRYIDWQKQKTAQMKDTYDFIRRKYAKILDKIEDSKCPHEIPTAAESKKLSTSEEKILEKFALRYPCKFENYTYEELLELDNNFTQKAKPLLDSEWAREYTENLYDRLQKKDDTKKFHELLQKSLSEILWDQRVRDEEEKNDMEYAKKAMKLSQFEKQMCTQIMETKQQARNLMRNRVRAEKEFAEQRDHQFSQFLNNLKDQIKAQGFEIDFEKKRQNELHERLFATKMKRIRQHYHEICYDTVLSLVDYAVRYGHFKRILENDVPEHFIHEWKNLFFTRQAIFDILEPMEQLLEEHKGEDGYELEEEEIIRLELDRQEALNDVEIKEYINYEYPWELDKLIPNFDVDSEERKYELLGNRVLAHTVFTLLEMKYPFPPQRLPADLPNFQSKAIIRGLPDKAISIPMQTLLEAHKIHVVRVECAINFVLKKFKDELIGITDIELDFDKFVSAAQSEDNKEFIRNLKVEDSKTSKTDYTNFAIGLPPNCKIVQTPKVIPEEDLKLSEPAECGRYAYEALSFGDSLPDYLLAAIIVEYIKDQDDINGFVLINYPNDYREVQILEEIFSGNSPPNGELLKDSDDIYLEESLIKHRKIIKDPYIDVRTSKFVKNPNEKQVPPPFESYFTCYIKLKETENILEEFVIWELNEENSELIDRFYAALGLNYSMYYEVMDKDILAQICMYVIGELSVPIKSYTSIFGEVLNTLDFPSADEKRTKSKLVKAEVSSSLKKSKQTLKPKRTSKMESGSALEIVKAPDESELFTLNSEHAVVSKHSEQEEPRELARSTVVFENEVVLPGDLYYKYAESNIPENIGVALASCWEAYEKSYINDMQQLFFSKRLQMNCLGPYIRFMKDKMNQIITLPSNKQNLVSQFQKRYNDFEDDWREASLTKNEWHCRVKELKNQLYAICDARKLYAESQRQALICDNWAVEELTTIANTYISCMQTELNMQYLILQSLHDFYLAALKRYPPSDRVQTSKPLLKIIRETSDVKDKDKSVEDKAFRIMKQNYLDLQLKNILIDYSNNPFNSSIENNVKIAVKLISENNDHYRSIITKEYGDIAKLILPSTRKINDTKSSEDMYKSNANKLIDEWLMATNGEMYRSNLRIHALQNKCYSDMKFFSDCIARAFSEIQEEINSYYNREIESVDRLCKFIQLAIEKGTKIPENLVLEHDTFLIDPNLLRFELEKDVEGVPYELEDITKFKLKKIAKLRSDFKLVAPSGIMMTEAFIYLLQDFVVSGKETSEGPSVPEFWQRIDPEEMAKLVYALYGETAYVDWRDFLIHCLCIRFPTWDELLSLRHNFRCKDLESTELISRDDFLNIEFWFEKNYDPEIKTTALKIHLTKQFLFELYEVEQDKTNYSALLLALCKSADPIEGFVTALSMANGKKICFVFEECEDAICSLIELKEYKDACLACALKCTEEFLEKLVHRVVDICEGTFVEELPYDPKEDPKKKKGKDKTKDKDKIKKLPTSSSQSMKKNESSSITVVDIPVKQTYICPPCEPEEEEKTERVEEEEIVQVEKLPPDPNVCYAVSQDVLWTILSVCLPWHFSLVPEDRQTPYANLVKDQIERLQGKHADGDIYVAMFLSDTNICRMLRKVRKFTLCNLLEEIEKICEPVA